MKLLFVCRGNVGRSQIAKAFFNKFSSSKNKAESAGSKVFEKEGQIIKNLGESAQMVIKAMKEDGINLSEEKRKQITPKMIKEADKIILIAERENIPKELFNNPKSILWDIQDPINLPHDKFVKTKNQIKKKVKNLLKEIESKKNLK